MIWILAQFGLRDVVHNWVVHVTHLRIPLQETGAFNLFRLAGGVGCRSVDRRKDGDGARAVQTAFRDGWRDCRLRPASSSSEFATDGLGRI